jgi:hypothetical protein
VFRLNVGIVKWLLLGSGKAAVFPWIQTVNSMWLLLQYSIVKKEYATLGQVVVCTGATPELYTISW